MKTEWVNKRHILISTVVVLLFLSWIIPIAVNIWYTNKVVHNECQALSVIQNSGIKIPSFESAVWRWYSGDGC